MLVNPAIELSLLYPVGHNTFLRKVDLFIDSGEFLVKTAETWDELHSVFKLRAEIFSQEYGAHLENQTQPGLDIDGFDQSCDHLLVFHKKSGLTVGTYRLLSSEFSGPFYSQQEFIMQSLLDYPGVKLELGRACIAPMHRNGTVMRLLWLGIAQYAREIRADLLFGCSSIKTVDPTEAAAVYKYLKERGHVSEKFVSTPALKYRIANFSSTLRELESSNEMTQAYSGSKIISPLLLSYLRAGGKVCGEPAIDLEFNCIDFLTVLETRELSERFERRFRLC